MALYFTRIEAFKCFLLDLYATLSRLLVRIPFFLRRKTPRVTRRLEIETSFPLYPSREIAIAALLKIQTL